MAFLSSDDDTSPDLDSGFEAGGGYDYSPPASSSSDVTSNSGFESGGGYDYSSLDASSSDDNQTIIPGVDDDEVKAMITKHEGDPEPEMYTDTKGNVTVGIGQMLPDAQSAINLPFMIQDGGTERPANDQEIAANYQSVKTGILNTPTVYLNEPDINDLFDKSLRQHAVELADKFENFDDIPSSAKLALLDMHYNLGGTKFNAQNWPGLFDAVNNEDWDTAALQSNRKDVGKERNLDTFGLFEGIPQVDF